MERGGLVPAQHTDLIAATISDLRELVREAALDFSLKVGALVVERFYGGDIERWRKRRKNCPPLRSLTEHPDLPISVSALYRCIALYELGQRTGGFSTWKHLGVSHLRTVIGLAEGEQQRWLEQAEANRWTVNELDEKVSAARAQLVRGGRPRLPLWVKSLRRLNRLAEQTEHALDAADFDPDSDEAELAELRGAAARLQQVVTRLDAAIERRTERSSRTEVIVAVGETKRDSTQVA